MPVRVVVTAGTTADCTQAVALIDGFAAQYLLADRGYDSDEIIDKAIATGCEIVIPPKKNRKVQRSYDKALYRVRHLVENTFLHLKRRRGIATRYAKRLTSFVAAVQIRCITLWLNVLT
jgi:transposase